MEALKYRLHRSRRGNLHFYRDSNGNEVDLLLSHGPDLYPVEIKAGMTINRDYFRGLDYFSGIFPTLLGRGLVYGGDEAQQRTATAVCPATMFHALLAGLEKE
ncbi:MAG: DUF4143 domain-containing protein [Deltaproteobacteria bacterium]|nr:DUF4143 domain-containing protein [Deltaproteobacteria bacterium]